MSPERNSKLVPLSGYAPAMDGDDHKQQEPQKPRKPLKPKRHYSGTSRSTLYRVKKSKRDTQISDEQHGSIESLEVQAAGESEAQVNNLSQLLL